MAIELIDFVDDFSAALKAVDTTKPIGSALRFKPGIGPLTESELTAAAISQLRHVNARLYADAAPRGYPRSRNTCDLVLPSGWAVEIKLARPFGDNGKPAERWSENLLYPYSGNTSSIGDCLKLLDSEFTERKAILVVGYEHTPPKIPLEAAIRGFELIATEVMALRIGPRLERLLTDLVHPCHQQARVYAWEVFGRELPSNTMSQRMPPRN